MTPITLKEYFESLSQVCRQGVTEELTSMLIPDLSGSVQDLAAKAHAITCPSCGGIKISENWKYKGIQRYVCKACCKYFRQTTGHVTYNMKKTELLSKYFYNMLLGYSIKNCAKETGISIQTSVEWRHKIISAFNNLRPSLFEGIIESDDIFFLESSKGSRSLPHKRRSRGNKATKRGISDDQVAVVVTQDRSGNQELAVVKKGRISKSDLDETLGEKIRPGSILCTDAIRSYTVFTKTKDIEHRKFIANKGQRVVNKVYHVQNVINTAKRLRDWMSPYNGVATKYLQNYMNWFMVLEKIKNEANRHKAFAAYALTSPVAYSFWEDISRQSLCTI